MQKTKLLDSSLKRLIDLVLAVFGIVVTSPSMIIIFLIIKIDSNGPAVFSQERVGLSGKKFKMYKFRSMVNGAEEILNNNHELKDEFEKEYKIKHDPRITKIGKFIRSYSLDELPQIFNVIKGEMSIVGPRPIQENELKKYGEHAEKYLSVKPGITGLWQVSGRNDLSYDERIKLDAHYAEKRSVLLDLFIIIKTFPVVIFGNGAY